MVTSPTVLTEGRFCGVAFSRRQMYIKQKYKMEKKEELVVEISKEIVIDKKMWEVAEKEVDEMESLSMGQNYDFVFTQ
ncbi:hypothetical protein HPP92_007359 [Vanilla planifolia]|uniref:Uncharacterized protein n=1 Tax=Vanilla planifolia TaxID=51239 RepID=A0A835VBS8_VANPL|nr:hypothetical protein HPP92_007359 [Vanilla planifolia]